MCKTYFDMNSLLQKEMGSAGSAAIPIRTLRNVLIHFSIIALVYRVLICMNQKSEIPYSFFLIFFGIVK